MLQCILGFCNISLYVVFIIIYFVHSLFSTFHAICKDSLFCILILHLLLLFAVWSSRTPQKTLISNPLHSGQK